MHKKVTIIQKVMMYIATLVLAVGYPISAMATTQEVTETSPATQTQTPVTTETPPTTTPQTTSPAPVQQAPVKSEPPKEPELTYVFNPTTQRWDSEKWQYNPVTNTYEKPVIITVDPVSEIPKDGDSTKLDTTKNVDTNVIVNNNIESDAKSGDAAIVSNTLAGSAASGNAEATAKLVNIVNSTVTTGSNAKVAEFTKDIYGDVKGDILLNPMLLKAFLEAGAGEAQTSNTLNANSNVQVNNNLDLTATSGNALVGKNTKAGDATTGNAVAMANVMNIINSMISTQQSFNGTINIYGNLEGDILIAPDFIPQLIESNAGLKNKDGSDVILSSQDTQTIVNNISAAATSGAAAVFGNSKAGNAKSGNADSKVVIFNLTGHEIVAENSLLVFINVMGSWVGAIVDAPQGATAAMIGNGVTSHKHTPNLVINADSEAGITNNITVAAISGDATVSQNTEAGNATSGNAQAIVNVTNMTNNNMALSGWGGELTINIFGTWKGCFGFKCTFNQKPIKQEDMPVPAGPIQFVPHTASTGTTSNYRVYAANTGNAAMYVVLDSESIADNRVLGDRTEIVAEKAVAGTNDTARTTSELVGESFDFRVFIVAGSILIVGASVIGLKRLLG